MRMVSSSTADRYFSWWTECIVMSSVLWYFERTS